MHDFIASQNVKRFRAQLQDCVDPQQRKILQGLLAEEEAKLKGLTVPNP